MVAIVKVEPLTSTSPMGTVRFDELFAGRDCYDDVSGMQVDRRLAAQARNDEIAFFNARGMYNKVRPATD